MKDIRTTKGKDVGPEITNIFKSGHHFFKTHGCKWNLEMGHITHPKATAPAIASPKAADLPRPLAAVNATVLLRVFSEMASINLRTAFAWWSEKRREQKGAVVKLLSELSLLRPTTNARQSFLEQEEGEKDNMGKLNIKSQINNVKEAVILKLARSKYRSTINTAQLLLSRHWPHNIFSTTGRCTCLGSYQRRRMNIPGQWEDLLWKSFKAVHRSGSLHTNLQFLSGYSERNCCRALICTSQWFSNDSRKSVRDRNEGTTKPDIDYEDYRRNVDFSRPASCLHSSPSTVLNFIKKITVIVFELPCPTNFKEAFSLKQPPSMFILSDLITCKMRQTSAPTFTCQMHSIFSLNTTPTWSRVLQPSTKTPTGCVSCKLSFSSFSSKSCGRRLSSYKHSI